MVNSAQWQMPMANDAQNFQSKLAYSFIQEVKVNTGNRIIIEPHPAGSLFKSEQIFGAVKSNLVPIGARLISALDHENPLLQLDALPFLAKNYTEAFNLYKASKVDLEALLKDKGVKLLYAVPWPSQGIYSRIEIQRLSDLKDLTFRPYSQVTANLGEKLGLTAVVIPIAEVSKAIKTKRLDVLFGSSLTGIKWRFGKDFPYWYDLQAWLPKEMVVVNLEVWGKLAAADQKVILNAAFTTEVLGWRTSKRASEQAKLTLRRSGFSVESFDGQLQREIEVLGLSVVEHWLQKVGDRGRYLLERYVSLKTGQ